ncbi:MarR family transcriptional regulator [Pollutibacter soli]|uniref:MarR family winged helix-turn-helix transcriptional regulator n=1 Tax=Pollutibacter soli TaxID=3034157 RepID=UPI00301417C5
MGLEKDINQYKFRNQQQKAIINLLYTHNWVMERIKKFVAEENITPQQYNMLRILRGSYPTPLSTLQIRDRMLDKMSDTSRIVDRLILKNLVKKTVSSADKRLVDVVITEQGQAVLQRLDEKNIEMDNVINHLDENEMTQLNVLLDKIRG